MADLNGIPIVNGASISSQSLRLLLQDARIDILFLFAYGRLLPAELLATPRYGSINLHPSPLPWYRGAAPIERQIIEVVPESAVSIIRMNHIARPGELLAQEPSPFPRLITERTLRPPSSALEFHSPSE